MLIPYDNTIDILHYHLISTLYLIMVTGFYQQAGSLVEISDKHWRSAGQVPGIANWPFIGEIICTVNEL